MPGTHRLLQDASETLMLKDEGFHIFQAVISSTDGTARFPNWRSGVENLNVEACGSNGAPKFQESCVDIPMLSLESYVDQHVAGTGPFIYSRLMYRGTTLTSCLGRGQYWIERTTSSLSSILCCHGVIFTLLMPHSFSMGKGLHVTGWARTSCGELQDASWKRTIVSMLGLMLLVFTDPRRSFLI